MSDLFRSLTGRKNPGTADAAAPPTPVPAVPVPGAHPAPDAVQPGVGQPPVPVAAPGSVPVAVPAGVPVGVPAGVSATGSVPLASTPSVTGSIPMTGSVPLTGSVPMTGSIPALPGTGSIPVITSVERFGTAGVGARQPFTDPGPLPPQAADEAAAKRRRTQMQVGAAFLATALLLPFGAYKFATRDRVEVVALAESLSAGDTVAPEHLTQTWIPQSASGDALTNPMDVVGETVKKGMPAGSIVKANDLGAAFPEPKAGEVSVAVNVPDWVWKVNGGAFEIGDQIQILLKAHTPKNGKGKPLPEVSVAIVTLKNYLPATTTKNGKFTTATLITQPKYVKPIKDALAIPGRVELREVAKTQTLAAP